MLGMVVGMGLLVDEGMVVVEKVEGVMGEEGLGGKEGRGKWMGEIEGGVVGMGMVVWGVLVGMGLFGGCSGGMYGELCIRIV